MGNCFKKSSIITDKYLFEPLNSDEEGCFGESPINENGVVSFEVKQKLEELSLKIIEIDNKINMLEQNTSENFKSISDDIYYINEKQNKNYQSETRNNTEKGIKSQQMNESETESKYASFVSDN